MNRERVGTYQYALLLIMIVEGTAFFFLPGAAARGAKRDAWLVPPVATLPAILVLSLANRLSSAFPGMTVSQYSQRILGELPGKLIGLFYGAMALQIGSVVVREVAELLVTMIMPETPVWAFAIPVALTSGYAASLGIEVIARVNQVVLPVFVAFGLLTSLMLLPSTEIREFLPLLENGIGPLIEGARLPAFWRMQTALLVLMVPQVASPPMLRRASIMAALFLATVPMLLVIAAVGSLGVAAASRSTFATFDSAKLIRYGEFIERLDAVVMMMWVAGASVKAAILTYCGSLAISQSTGLKDVSLIAWVASGVAAIFSIVQFRDFLAMFMFFERLSSIQIGLTTVLIPVILLVVAYARRMLSARK